jgi:hypothetical protein
MFNSALGVLERIHLEVASSAIAAAGHAADPARMIHRHPHSAAPCPDGRATAADAGLPRQRHQQSGEQRTILRSNRHSVPTKLSFKDGDLVTENQVLRVLLTIAHRQKPHRGEGAADRQVGKAQQHR